MNEITKLDAAVAQLRTAIRLYFNEDDPISIHTLATASGEIVCRLCSARGKLSMRALYLQSLPQEERRKKGDLLNSARNFFKHGSEGVLKGFNDEVNHVMLAMCVASMVYTLDVRVTEIAVFQVWVALTAPELRLQVLEQFGDNPPQLLQLLHRLPRSSQKKFANLLLKQLADQPEIVLRVPPPDL